jgi:hypothetical protein
MGGRVTFILYFPFDSEAAKQLDAVVTLDPSVNVTCASHSFEPVARSTTLIATWS